MVDHIIHYITNTLTLDKLACHLVVTVCALSAVVAAVLIDFFDGIYTAKKLKQKLQSNRFRRTINKIAEYWRVLLLALVFDTMCLLLPWYAFSYITLVVTLALLVIEGKSLLEHYKRRKSALAELPDLLKAIVSCATERDAGKLIESITQYGNNHQKK